MPASALAAYPEMSRPEVTLLGLATGCAAGVDFVATSMLATGAVHIRAGVYATPDDFLWCLTAYAGAAIVANVMVRRLAELISYRGYTMLGLTIALIGSILCAVSDNVTQLSMALAVQGLGAGGLFAASRTLIQIIGAPAERPRLLWPFLLGALGMSAAAPWITAILMLDAGWRMIFALQGVTTIGSLVFVTATYPHRIRPPQHFDLRTLAALDWLTVSVLASGSLILVHGLADLRLYTAASTISVLAWPLIGATLVAAAFMLLRRHPDPWLSTDRLIGPRYLTGLTFYAIYAFFVGLWTYVIPNLLQLGLGFTFEASGRAMTTASLTGVAAGIVFILYGNKLPGTRRYLCLGYLMTAGAAWLLADRIMTGLSMERVLEVLLLQGVALPFTLILVAKLAFMETPLEDFPHAYQFKNIVRQVASAAGTGVAAQCLQYGEAVARTNLVGRVDVFHQRAAQNAKTWVALSDRIDQQAVLLASANLLVIVVVGCLLVAIGAILQRWLR